MMTKKLITQTLIITYLALWLSNTMIATSAQEDEPVLDTDGNPVRGRSRTAEYWIKPAASESGGGFTLLGRTDRACPIFVGQRNVSSEDIRAVRFTPHNTSADTVFLGRNFRVAFSGDEAPCGGPLTWRTQGPFGPPNRRSIAIGAPAGFSSYFLISKFQDFDNVYVFEWCPAELCPTCRFACGSVGLQVLGGRRFFALDGNGTGFPFVGAFPVVFERVYYNRNDVKIDNNVYAK